MKCMDKNLMRTCVRFRRVGRHPVIQRSIRSSALLKKHVIRATAFSIVPGALNDVVFHHAPLTLQEVVHSASDSVTVTTISAVVSLITTSLRL